MKTFENLEIEFHSTLNNNLINDYDKTCDLDFIINEMIRLIDNDNITDIEMERGLQINNLYADFIYNLNIKLIQDKINSLVEIKKYQDEFLDVISETDNEADKKLAIINLKLIHKISMNNDGDIEKEIDFLKNQINKLKLDLFTLKNEY